MGAGERSHGFYTKQRGESLRGSPLIDTCLGKTDAPLGYGDGLKVRLFLLETAIHDLGLIGDSIGLRKALKEYLGLWIALERGES